MSAATRLLGSLVVLTWGLLALASGPAWVGELGLSWAADEEQRGLRQRLEYEGKAVLQRITAKERVVDRLLAGDLTLLEAAAWFKRLNETPEDCPFRSVEQEGDSEGERLCRQVIGWVAAEVNEKMPPSQAQAIIAQLEEELCEHLALHGTVVLPGEE